MLTVILQAQASSEQSLVGYASGYAHLQWRVGVHGCKEVALCMGILSAGWQGSCATA